jgi:hypothetical protein
VKRLFVAAALLALAGCSAPDLQALADDKNADCVTETSVWVTIKFDRNWGCEYPPPGMTLLPAQPAPAKASP